MTDLFFEADLNREDFQNILNRESFGRNKTFFGPVTALFHPGLLLGMMARGISDVTTRTIRVPSSPREPFLRVVGPHIQVDFPTTMRTIQVLYDANMLERVDATDYCGRDIYLLIGFEYRLYLERLRDLKARCDEE